MALENGAHIESDSLVIFTSGGPNGDSFVIYPFMCNNS